MSFKDVDVDDFEEEIVIVPILDELIEDTRAFAIYCIGRFFENKEMHYGGPIPKHFLESEKYIEMVMNLGVEDGISKAYQHMGTSEVAQDVLANDEEDDEGDISSDVKIVVSVHQECSKLQIPKYFSAGITIMYLELCRGIKPAKRIHL